MLSNIVKNIAKYCSGLEQQNELQFSSGQSDIDKHCQTWLTCLVLSLPSLSMYSEDSSFQSNKNFP